MTPLEQRIAEAVRSVIGENSLVPGELGEIARAVVAVLPTADVGDEAIFTALDELPGFQYYESDGPKWVLSPTVLQAAVRALLDAQAAAHAADWATETNGESLAALVEKYRSGMDTAIADRDAAQDELARRLSQLDDVLAAERAAHDAEVEALRTEVQRGKDDYARAAIRGQDYLERACAAEAEVERLRSLRDQSMNADGEHMADLAVTIKIQAGQIATLSNQLDYANEGKAALEAELVRLRADRDAYRARIDAVRKLNGLCVPQEVLRAALGDA
jgi:hypothetical protein